MASLKNIRNFTYGNFGIVIRLSIPYTLSYYDIFILYKKLKVGFMKMSTKKLWNYGVSSYDFVYLLSDHITIFSM